MRKSLSLLIKPVSGTCNLRCKYCFYHDVAENRQQKNFGMMSEAVLETIVKKAFNYADGFITFAFQGGEPTLRGIDFYKKLIDYVRKYNSKNIKIQFSIQTNGTLVNDEWAMFFKNNNFLVGLSMDGYREINDLNRVDVNGKGTFQTIKNAAIIMDKYEVDYNILCVVTKPIAQHGAKVYNYFKSNGYKYLQFIPCLDNFGEENGKKPYSLTTEAYGNFLISIFDLWYKDILDNNYTSIRMFDNLINILKGYQPESCDMVGHCSKGTVFESDGSLYPCDFYVTDEWKAGNIMESNFEELLSQPVMDKFVETSKMLYEECQNCDYYHLCRSGCRRHKENEEFKNIFCDAYKKFYEHSYERLMYIAKNV